LNGTHPINRSLIKSTIKKVIGTEIPVLLCYPEFNKPVLFHLYTDASDHQLGAVIVEMLSIFRTDPEAYDDKSRNT
jgi:hypothetical protein